MRDALWGGSFRHRAVRPDRGSRRPHAAHHLLAMAIRSPGGRRDGPGAGCPRSCRPPSSTCSDLAAWLVHSVEDGHGRHLQCSRAVDSFLGYTSRQRRPRLRATLIAVAAPEQWLLDHEVAEWAGGRSLPLWVSDRSWHGFGAEVGGTGQRGGSDVPPARRDTPRRLGVARVARPTRTVRVSRTTTSASS